MAINHEDREEKYNNLVEPDGSDPSDHTNKVLKESFLLEVRWYHPNIGILTDKRDDFCFRKDE